MNAAHKAALMHTLESLPYPVVVALAVVATLTLASP